MATLDADKRGLVTCYYSGPIEDPSYNATSGDSGIRLWIATSETTFEQISWQPGMPSWIVERQWTGLNGHAQPACNGWSSGSVTYAMFVDQDDQVAFYWNDHGSDGRNNPVHPMNTWEKGASLRVSHPRLSSDLVQRLSTFQPSIRLQVSVTGMAAICSPARRTTAPFSAGTLPSMPKTRQSPAVRFHRCPAMGAQPTRRWHRGRFLLRSAWTGNTKSWSSTRRKATTSQCSPAMSVMASGRQRRYPSRTSERRERCVQKDGWTSYLG